MQIIQRHGAQALLAASGDEALQMAQDSKPSLILLDITMSGMDGFHVCRMLNKNTVTQDIPVVMVSSKKNKADKIWAHATTNKLKKGLKFRILNIKIIQGVCLAWRPVKRKSQTS